MPHIRIFLFIAITTLFSSNSLTAEDIAGSVPVQEIVAAGEAALPAVPQSLYERLGGEAGIKAVVDDFVGRAAANPAVNFTRVGQPKTWEATPENIEILKKHLAQFIAVATGAQGVIYQGRDMRTAHEGMKISNAEFDAFATDLKTSLAALNVPAKEQEELLAIAATTRGQIVEEAPSLQDAVKPAIDAVQNTAQESQQAVQNTANAAAQATEGLGADVAAQVPEAPSIPSAPSIDVQALQQQVIPVSQDSLAAQADAVTDSAITAAKNAAKSLEGTVAESAKAVQEQSAQIAQPLQDVIQDTIPAVQEIAAAPVEQAAVTSPAPPQDFWAWVKSFFEKK